MMISKKTVLIVVLCVLAQASPGFAGERSTGKYAGIPIFDRWDGCTLYSGIYVMYMSEKVKEDLRPYAGKAVLIDAKQVYQPINPGDGRIGTFKYLSPAPAKRNWVTLAGITLKSTAELDTGGKVIVTLSIKNTGKKPVKLFSQELALTLLTKRPASKRGWFVADGPSYALITRNSFRVGGSEPRWQGKGVAGGKRFTWTIGKENALPHNFTLGPDTTRSIRIHFDLPPGEYDFLGGYGGGVHEGKCLASNLVAFDVGKDRKGKIVAVNRNNKMAPVDCLAGKLTRSEENAWGNLFNSSWGDIAEGMSAKAQKLGLIQEQDEPYLVWKKKGGNENCRWVFVNDPSAIQSIREIYNNEANANSPACYVVVKQVQMSPDGKRYDTRGDVIFDIFRLTPQSYLWHHNRVFTPPKK